MSKPEKSTFIPGDEWLYFKIYGGVGVADHFLCNEVRPLSEGLVNEKLIDKFFFLRYSDPNPHLRVRFHLTDPANSTQIVLNRLNAALKPYLENGLIWRMQADTYERETWRYGRTTISSVEELFSADSTFVMQLLSLEPETGSDTFRWKAGMLAMDSFINDFGFTVAGKASYYEYGKCFFENEFPLTKRFRMQLDQRYRELHETIGSLLNGADETAVKIRPALHWKSGKIMPVITLLQQKAQQDVLENSLNEMIFDCLHLSINRLFRSKQRRYEMVLYYFLWKHYTSELAKQG
jgi:lantibiotic biosynthesis protein